MKMLWLSLVVAGAAALAGCRSAPPDPAAPDTPPVAAPRRAVGLDVSKLLRHYEGHRLEYFDHQGRKLDRMPEGMPGSVSVFSPDGRGQENFAFDEAGRVLKHMRSRDANYQQGIWVEIKD